MFDDGLYKRQAGNISPRLTWFSHVSTPCPRRIDAAGEGAPAKSRQPLKTSGAPREVRRVPEPSDGYPKIISLGYISVRFLFLRFIWRDIFVIVFITFRLAKQTLCRKRAGDISDLKGGLGVF